MDRASKTIKSLILALLIPAPFQLHAAAAADPAAFCARTVTADEITATATGSDGKVDTRKLLELTKVKFADAYVGTQRKEEFIELMEELAGQFDSSKLAVAVLAQQLTAGVTRACQDLVGKDATDIRTAAYAAAGLGAPTGPAKRREEENSLYLFFVGDVNSLEADGGWKSSWEASFVSVTQFFGPPLDAYPSRIDANSTLAESLKSSFKWKPRGYGRIEVTFSEIGKIDEAAPEAEPTEPPPAEEEETSKTNPFAVGGGILRVNIGPDILLSRNGLFGVTAGAGFTTRPSKAEGADVDARARWYAGLLFLANYGSSENNKGRVTGRLAIGYARDKFWKWTDVAEVDGETIETPRNESQRWFLDARIDGPGIFKSDSVKLSLRLFADHPKSGHGPTDVRISLLVSADLGGLKVK